MPRIAYTNKTFSNASQSIITMANLICAEYQAQGLDLTLRQVYYQFVARGLIANKDTEYKRLGSIINDARLAGDLDWRYIVDRTRNLRGRTGGFDDPAQMIKTAATGYYIEKWTGQPIHVEVWIEKDALVGVLETACADERVGYFSCRGYTSQSEIWSAAQRLGRAIDDGKRCVILHLGDHDPSGVDMTRDIEHRLATFIAQDRFGAYPGASIDLYLEDVADSLTVDRIALTWRQVQQYQPPPNPAKITDSRARGYIEQYGHSSWELDALDPATLIALIRDGIDRNRDPELWQGASDREDQEREILTLTTDNWPEIAAHIEETYGDG